MSTSNQPLDSNPISSNSSSDPIQNFYLERYKYILSEIRSLNENFHKYLNVFQTLATAISTAGVAVFVGQKQLNLTPEIAKIAIQGLLGLLIILALYVVVSISIGIYAWFDYRKEEVELLNLIFGSRNFRKSPKLGNLFYWQETYIILFIFLAVAVITVYVQGNIIPLIK
jgi:hypothetical protein